MSRRRFLGRAVAATGLAAVGATALTPTAGAALEGRVLSAADVEAARQRARAALTPPSDPANRPSGGDYVRYEDLYRQGDSVNQALARLTEPKIVTFPEGRFVCSDFDGKHLAGISVPPICRGLVGSGPGSLGGSDGTVFTMTPRSSSRGNGSQDAQGNLYVPLQGSSTPTQLNVLKQVYQRAPAVWRNFQLACTDQGHIFSGMQVYGTAGANTFENLLITGFEGNSGEPPGETSGLSVSGKGAHRLTRIEVDGRRDRGGPAVGAMGLTVQNTVGVEFRDCYAHHLRAGSYVMFQSFDGYLVDCTSDSLSTDAAGRLGNGGINFERTAGWTMARPVILGRPNKVHVSHSNDQWTMSRDGVDRSVSDGSLTIIDGAYNDLWGDGLLYLQSWTPYWNGDSMKTPPVLLGHDWKSRVRYKWVHDKHYVIS